MNRFLTSLIVVLATANIQAQQLINNPKLVVGITIDQLRGDYIQYLFNAFGEKGFKRLMCEGIVYDNVKFDLENVDRASATATIYSGAYPNYHGIIANTFFDPHTKRIQSCVYDSKFLGNYTTDNISPANLLTSTITDELKIATNGLSDVYSIAPNYDQAVLAAGHAANGAFWLDDYNGKWATTTYFKEVPWFVDRYNMSEALDKRIEDMEWSPLNPIDSYNHLPYLQKDFTFKYNFSKIKKERYKSFKSSALVNSEVNRLVFKFLEHGRFGQRQNPDFISIGYNAGNYENKSVQECSVEIQDTYLRLDKELELLLDALEKKVGLKNTVIFLTSTGYSETEGKESESFNIPTGEFFPKRCVALLNMYLMAIYGQENWVEGYHDRQIFLNRKLIENKQKNLREMQSHAAEFIIQMSGVQQVTTSQQLLLCDSNGRINRLRNGFHQRKSGDLLIDIRPGWKIAYEDINFDDQNIRKDCFICPLIFFGPQLKATRIKREISAAEIAPTVSRILRIRSPNASTERELSEFL